MDNGWAGSAADVAWTAPAGSFKLRAGAIVRDGDRILLCTTDGVDGWYLPGGKVEFGEFAAAAVVRELREELGVDARTVERVPGEWPLRQPYVLRVWTARLRPASAAPAPLQDHDALRWLTPEEIWDVDWLVQDVPAVREVAARLAAGSGAGAGRSPRAAADRD